MTILGKILVIVNFVFSIITGLLIVMVFVTRTNWRVGFDELKHNYEVATANAKTYRDEVEVAKTQGEIEKKRIQDQLDEEIKITTGERDKLAAKAKELEDQLTVAKQASVSVDALTEEAAKRKSETDKLAAQVAELQGKILTYQDDAKKANDKAIEATIARNNEHVRNLQLVELSRTQAQENEELRAKLGNAGAGGATGSTALKPPAEDVEGLVTDSDPKTGLVTISIGSDSGVNKNNTLEVYRLTPTPQYVGTIRIVDARFHEAVGRALSLTGAAPIKKGDKVASRIAVHGG